MGGYAHFIGQLDSFLKRYYLNRAFKGLLLFLALFAFVVLTLGIVQMLAFCSGKVRAILFYSALAVLMAGALVWVVYPLLQGRGVLPRMSRMQAAHYLSERFPELGDKLYNVLELKAAPDAYSASLLEAAVQQITSGFAAYRFEKAVSFRNILPYLYGVCAFLAVFVFVLLFEPRLMRSTAQVVRYQKEFVPESPFTIKVLNPALNVAYEEDFELRVEVEGERLPEKLFLCRESQRLEMKRLDANTFSYIFRKVRRNEEFLLKAGRYESGMFLLKVDYNPLLSAMRAVLRYPVHTGMKPEVFDKSLDFEVPFGTKIEWELKFDYARNLSVLCLPVADAAKFLPVDSVHRPVFRFQTQVFSDFRYILIPFAFHPARPDSLQFSVKCIPDAYPHLQVQGKKDSLHPMQIFYQGFISDDYGFHELLFSVRCTHPQTGTKWEKYDTLSLASGKVQNFTYFFDLENFVLEPGDELVYGFSLADNDPFYPYKTVYSPTETYRKKSLEEVKEEISQTAAGIDRSFSFSLQQSRSFQEDLQKLAEDLLSKQQFSWQDRQKVELLMERQQELKNRYDALAEDLEKKRELERETGVEDADILEKQQQLQDLLNRLLDDKTLEKLQELQALMEKQAGQEKVMEKVEELKFQQNLTEKDLERNLNLFRRMEFEMRMESLSRDARALAEKGEALEKKLERESDKTLARNVDSLLAEHNKLQADLSRLKEDMQMLKDLDEKLDKPNGFRIPDSLVSALEKQMSQTERSMRENNSKSSRQSHEKTQENLENLASDLAQQMMDIAEENDAEDADFIRLLLKSVVRVSLEQEDLMVKLERTKVNDPRYSDLIRRQSALNMEIRFVADSVRAISSRQPQVAVVTREALHTLETNSRESLDYLLGMYNIYYQRYSVANSRALTRQQYSMTALNDLALLLSRSLDNIQEKMQMRGGGASSKKKKKGQPQMSCPNPGATGQPDSKMPFPSLSKQQDNKSLQEMQKALNAQIETLKKMLAERAEQEARRQAESGEKKSGAGGGAGGEQISDEEVSEAFARAAARQEMIRRMLQEKMAKEKGMDPNVRGLYNSVLGEMERTEKDLVNKILDPQMLVRQKKIETRLLEAENAELKREKDDKRESKQGRVFAPVSLDSLQIENTRDMRTRELLLRHTPELKPFYREKLEKYRFGQ